MTLEEMSKYWAPNLGQKTVSESQEKIKLERSVGNTSRGPNMILTPNPGAQHDSTCLIVVQPLLLVFNGNHLTCNTRYDTTGPGSHRSCLWLGAPWRFVLAGHALSAGIGPDKPAR